MFSDKLEPLIYVKYELFGTLVEKFILHNKFVFIPSAIIQAASFIFLSYLINLI